MDETWWRSPDQLDPDQQEIVSLPLEGSHLVVGPPGSGKTNLLLLRASYLARAGFPNIATTQRYTFRPDGGGWRSIQFTF